ncbi:MULTISPECIES: ABC transporter permease subunit [unclassified Mesorhizobium]|uniref:ABC transporter permease subunit n=2 Tax=Mesorhizobium TaxID=68287 RepID=UPI000FD35E16|nr:MULTISPECIES: ABC transporter permease subunit [unclassified Mesorhizobium]AZV18893.1 ABC transporter permease subunit [Mesorhizobium sp. M7A.F.Ce.TU.012.03.2.1]RUU77871.1 ABC transporter permease subunit [Mesorhizobium sp. M7A.F.Ca.MR.362.00.0.0]RWN97489.1 MAG: ABC transporter permease subunit [Mesorhizobium sp.]RWO85289.1 MAG: ABC transporter permease subunit [Mesorhizobium sp.]TIM19707.1 MAG: ABC transporter permease subunit [Mesorhizobium sp.]
MTVTSYTERAGHKIDEADGLSVPWSRPSPKRKGVSARAVSAVTILMVLALWALSARLQLVSPVFLPSPAAVWNKFITVARDGFVDATLLQHAVASLGRVFAALVAALAIGVPVGLAIGISTIGRGIFDPLLEFLRPIPPLAYLPLVIIWFGIGEPSKILVIAIAMLAPVALSTASGVRGVSQERINAARSLGATQRQVVRHVILPSALPSILTGLRIALGAGWSTLVAAELVAATRGLGFMIQSAAQFLVTDVVVMGILVIAAIAFVLEFTIRRIERVLVPWAGRE